MAGIEVTDWDSKIGLRIPESLDFLQLSCSSISIIPIRSDLGRYTPTSLVISDHHASIRINFLSASFCLICASICAYFFVFATNAPARCFGTAMVVRTTSSSADWLNLIGTHFSSPIAQYSSNVNSLKDHIPSFFHPIRNFLHRKKQYSMEFW